MDNYIIMEGGIVQNTPSIPILDLDVLDTDTVDEVVVSEVAELRSTAESLGLQAIADKCASWLVHRGGQVTFVAEATVDGVEYVTVLDYGGNPVVYEIPRAEAEATFHINKEK